MPAYIKTTGGTWSNAISAFYIKSTTWRTISAGYIKVAGVWRAFFTSALTPSIAATVEISRNNATYPSTLTGTNYHWNDSTSLTYVFQKSSDNSSWSNIGSATSIANPSSGSSNTVTYALTLSDFPAFTSYYRFVVTAVNSTYSTTATSTSSSVTVTKPAPINSVQPTITPTTGTVGVTEYSVNSNGTWDPDDADGIYEYLWQSYDSPNYVSAPGVNNLSTYTPPSNFLTLGYFSPIRCRVTATNPSGSTSAVSSNTAAVLGVALTPTFGSNTSTSDGFTGSITNYDTNYTWGISTSSGSVSFGTASGSTRPFTVTGLSSSASATVTVTTSRTGYSNGTAQTTGTALVAPSPPTNVSSSATTTSITLSFTAGANSTSTRAYINGIFDGSTSGTSYTFLGLSPGTSYTLALYGYNGTVQSSTSSGGTYSTTNGAALTPTFGSNTSTSGGFTGSVTNYNASYTWGIATSSGSVSFGTPSGSTYPFTVTGLGSGASATVTVTTSRSGYNNGSAQTTGTATVTPSPPTITSSSVTTTSITLNFTLGANSTSTRAYINGSLDGSTAGTSYTFSGLSANTTYTLALFGYNGVVQSTTSSGGSYTTNKNPALTPTFGSNTSVAGGFTGSVTNYDANYTWNTPSVAASTLTVGTFTWGSIAGSTRTFTVSGLSASESSTVTVTTTRTNYFDGSAQTTGSASANVAPSGGSISISLTSGTSGQVGAVYTASVTNASGTPTPTFTRQWKRSANYSPFTVTNVGTDSATYTSTYADVDCAINCVVTFTNAAGSQTATSNSLQVSPPSITGIGAVRTNNTAPYVTWNIVGINIQSSQGTVKYGATSSLGLTSGTDPQANTALQRATSSRSGSTANFYRYDSVTAFSGTGQSGRSTSTISTTTIVQANANATTTVYGTYP